MALLPPMSTKSLKFTDIGTTHTGTLIEISEPQQETEYRADGSGPPAFWDDAKTRPRMQVKLTVQCPADPTIGGDDGKRALFATVSGKPGGLYFVINKALESATRLGGQLTVVFTGVDPESQNPQNPRKVYSATYVEPPLGLGGQPAAAPAAPPAPAAPAAAAAPAAPAKPANFPQEAWDSLTDEARATVAAAQ